jgi:hypothetical protein
MAYRVNLTLPRTPEIGRALSLTLPIVSDGNAAQTASGGTLTVRLGSLTLLDEVAITSAGPPASYSLLAATTEDQAPSAEWQEIWTLTGLGTFTWSGYLVRYSFRSTLADAHLEQRHPEILSLLPPGEATAEKYRVAASEQVQKDLIKKGRRPWLVVDSWALHDAELYFALHLWAQDARMRTAGASASTYRELADEYLAQYRAELGPGGVTFRYDGDEDGVVNGDQVETAVSSGIVLSAGPRRRQWVA